VDFAEVAELQRQDRWDDAADLLAGAAKGLEAAGAELLLICTNTMHKVAPQVQAATSVPLLHIGDSTADAVHAAGLTTVGLLGTRFTMEQPFLREHLAARGLEVLVPSAVDRSVVHDVIFDELCVGVVREESRRAYQAVITALVEAGAQGIVLGCTEIELLVRAEDSPVPVFPTTRLHVTTAVERALAC
jgi:aspartate racemase